MDSLRIDRSGYTLVDQVEEKLIQYFKEQGLRPGSSIPNENELAASLGIGPVSYYTSPSPRDRG